MRIILALIAALAILPMATGCGLFSSETVITEFDKDGKITKTTTTNDSVIKSLAVENKDKTVIIWEDGWFAYLRVSAATVDNPSPTFAANAGKLSRGAMFAHKDQKDFSGMSKVVSATRDSLSVSQSGIKSGSDKTDEATNEIKKE